MQDMIKNIITEMGEDINREGLKDTPKRAAKALQFLTKGYHEDINVLVNDAIFESDMDEMVIVRDIELYSLCEHHLLPFYGRCHVAYIPNGKVLGLSKVSRIIDHFARRLQIQENLTDQIARCIMTITQARGVGVIVEARHLCMMMRGVEKQSSTMTTSKMMGELKDNPKSRAEFLSLINKSSLIWG